MLISISPIKRTLAAIINSNSILNANTIKEAIACSKRIQYQLIYEQYKAISGGYDCSFIVIGSSIKIVAGETEIPF
jgi:hypothetical protein